MWLEYHIPTQTPYTKRLPGVLSLPQSYSGWNGGNFLRSRPGRRARPHLTSRRTTHMRIARHARFPTAVRLMGATYPANITIGKAGADVSRSKADDYRWVLEVREACLYVEMWGRYSGAV